MKKIKIDILGKRYGRLIAIKELGNGPLGKWVFRCDCGVEKKLLKQNVMQGKTTSCGCLVKEMQKNKIINIIGNRYGRLTVIKIIDDGQCKCLCDCGKEIIVDRGNLKNRHTKSCGCLSIYRHPKEDVGLRKLFYRYRYRAKRIYKKEFTLTLDEFKDLTSQSCHYCGSSPNKTMMSKSDNSKYLYNGLDRINSKVGYVSGNVLPCCIVCNRMKLNLGYDNFKIHIQNIYSYWADDIYFKKIING